MQTEVCNLGGQGFSTSGQEVLRRASKPHFSRTRNGFLFSGISMMRCTSFRCERVLVAQTSVCVHFRWCENQNHTG